MSSFCFAVGFDIMVVVIIMKNEGSLASQCSLQQYTNEKSYFFRTALQVHYITWTFIGTICQFATLVWLTVTPRIIQFLAVAVSSSWLVSKLHQVCVKLVNVLIDLSVGSHKKPVQIAYDYRLPTGSMVIYIYNDDVHEDKQLSQHTKGNWCVKCKGIWELFCQPFITVWRCAASIFRPVSVSQLNRELRTQVSDTSKSAS